MFTMKSKIASDALVDLDDQANVKFALTALGYHDDSEEGLSPYSSNRMYDGIKTYQKNKSLKVDGLINPEGETHTSLKRSLEEDEKAGNAFGDMWRNYKDMKKVDRDGVDKYFHCKANYEASSRGWGGETAAELIDLKELKDQYKHGVKDSTRDLRANMYGRDAAKSGKYQSARDGCAIFRTPDVPDEY